MTDEYRVNAEEVDVMDGWTCVDSRPIGGISHFIESEDKTFAISYNPDRSIGFLDKLAQMMGEDKTGEETALIIRHKNKAVEFLILKGDWRAAYEPLVPLGLQACKEFYERNKAQRTITSDDYRKDMRLMA